MINSDFFISFQDDFQSDESGLVDISRASLTVRHEIEKGLR